MQKYPNNLARRLAIQIMFFKKIGYTGSSLIILGTVYSIYVFWLGTNCYGMECIPAALAAGTIYVGGYPWSLLIQLLPEQILPPGNGDLIRNPSLQIHNWTSFLIVYVSFILNFWLLGWLLEKSFMKLKDKYAKKTGSSLTTQPTATPHRAALPIAPSCSTTEV